jgi:hypothetical protein
MTFWGIDSAYKIRDCAVTVARHVKPWTMLFSNQNTITFKKTLNNQQIMFCLYSSTHFWSLFSCCFHKVVSNLKKRTEPFLTFSHKST